mmetsp:Transcript_3644/g.12952  ORF Transcript_3644/g.12952 Transcript_3644/m.12952 type:complete len:436 (-) Transcript_3644:786-2093(-)
MFLMACPHSPSLTWYVTVIGHHALLALSELCSRRMFADISDRDVVVKSRSSLRPAIHRANRDGRIIFPRGRHASRQKRRTTIVTSKFHGGERVLHFEGQSEQQPADQRGARLDSYSFCQGGVRTEGVLSVLTNFSSSTLEGKYVLAKGCSGSITSLRFQLSSADSADILLHVQGGPWAMFACSVLCGQGVCCCLSLQSNCTLVATHVGGLSPEEPAEDGITAMHCSTLVIRYSTLRGIGASKRNAAQFFAPAQVEHLAEVIARDPPPINDGSQEVTTLQVSEMLESVKLSFRPSGLLHACAQIVHRGKDQDSKEMGDLNLQSPFRVILQDETHGEAPFGSLGCGVTVTDVAAAAIDDCLFQDCGLGVGVDGRGLACVRSSCFSGNCHAAFFAYPNCSHSARLLSMANRQQTHIKEWFQDSRPLSLTDLSDIASLT